MTSSMTAFSRTEQDLDGTQLIWEIRSVNHRYLDVNIRLPDELRPLEPECRSVISRIISRGRVDAQLKLEMNHGPGEDITLDDSTLERLSNAIKSIEQQFPGIEGAKSLDILRWPGVIVETKMEAEELHKSAIESLENALSELSDSRTREGSELAEIIAERATQCRQIISDLDARMPEIQQKVQNRLVSKIDELGVELEPDRLAQEVVLMMTKSDVKEELDRMGTHLDEVGRLIGDNNKPVGRSLDFIMQELNREANTLGSKSIDTEMSNASIELKVLVEQMREQVQNIE